MYCNYQHYGRTGPEEEKWTVPAIHPHTRNQFGDFVVKSTRESDVLFGNTLLPQQFGVSRWSFQRQWSLTHSNHAHHTYPSFHYSTQKAPAQLFILSRLAFGRLPALKECRGLLVYWMLVSVVPLHALIHVEFFVVQPLSEHTQS